MRSLLCYCIEHVHCFWYTRSRYKLVSEVGLRMAQMDLPLPEITKEDFLRAWTRFELVAAAKEWNAAKQATVLPTLLRGKLVDIFIELDDDTRADLTALKKALMSKAGLIKDPLVAGKEGCHYSTERHGTARHIPEQFNPLFSGTEQLFNINLHVNSSCLGLWSDIYSY